MSQENVQRTVLLIGGSNVGKTHYGGQLLGRVKKGENQLVLRGLPASISPLEEVFKCLADGRSAAHTPSTSYEEVVLSLKGREDNPFNVSFDLIWPDYGGEQILRFVTQRRFSPEWKTRIREARSWVVFIRPDATHLHDDPISRPQGHIASSASTEAPRVEEKTSSQGESEDQKERPLSDSAFFVELLQVLIFAGGANTFNPLNAPHLCIVLSCWDEIDNGENGRLPLEELQQRLPLVAEFIRCNWEDACYSVWGLSALERALRDDQSDEDYLDNGPDSFGFVVQPNGQKSRDLTLPLVAALGMPIHA